METIDLTFDPATGAHSLDTKEGTVIVISRAGKNVSLKAGETVILLAPAEAVAVAKALAHHGAKAGK